MLESGGEKSIAEQQDITAAGRDVRTEALQELVTGAETPPALDPIETVEDSLGKTTDKPIDLVPLSANRELKETDEMEGLKEFMGLEKDADLGLVLQTVRSMFDALDANKKRDETQELIFQLGKAVLFEKYKQNTKGRRRRSVEDQLPLLERILIEEEFLQPPLVVSVEVLEKKPLVAPDILVVGETKLKPGLGSTENLDKKDKKEKSNEIPERTSLLDDRDWGIILHDVKIGDEVSLVEKLESLNKLRDQLNTQGIALREEFAQLSGEDHQKEGLRKKMEDNEYRERGLLGHYFKMKEALDMIEYLKKEKVEKEKSKEIPERTSLLDALNNLKEKSDKGDEASKIELNRIIKGLNGRRTYHFKNGERQYVTLNINPDNFNTVLITYDEGGNIVRTKIGYRLEKVKYREFKKMKEGEGLPAKGNYRTEDGQYVVAEFSKSDEDADKEDVYKVEYFAITRFVFPVLQGDIIKHEKDDRVIYAEACKGRPVPEKGGEENSLEDSDDEFEVPVVSEKKLEFYKNKKGEWKFYLPGGFNKKKLNEIQITIKRLRRLQRSNVGVGISADETAEYLETLPEEIMDGVMKLLAEDLVKINEKKSEKLKIKEGAELKEIRLFLDDLMKKYKKLVSDHESLLSLIPEEEREDADNVKGNIEELRDNVNRIINLKNENLDFFGNMGKWKKKQEEDYQESARVCNTYVDYANRLDDIDRSDEVGQKTEDGKIFQELYGLINSRKELTMEEIEKRESENAEQKCFSGLSEKEAKKYRDEEGEFLAEKFEKEYMTKKREKLGIGRIGRLRLWVPLIAEDQFNIMINAGYRLDLASQSFWNFTTKSKIPKEGGVSVYMSWKEIRILADELIEKREEKIKNEVRLRIKTLEKEKNDELREFLRDLVAQYSDLEKRLEGLDPKSEYARRMIPLELKTIAGNKTMYKSIIGSHDAGRLAEKGDVWQAKARVILQTFERTWLRILIEEDSHKRLKEGEKEPEEEEIKKLDEKKII